MNLNYQQRAVHTSFVTAAGNVLLSAFKLTAGILAHSSAMISDAVHTLSDVLSTVIVVIGVKASSRSADGKHPFGHERMECVAAVILAAILFATGLGIGWQGIGALWGVHSHVIPGTLAVWAAAVSIVVKEALYWYTRKAAIQIHSSALMADAWHHRSDAFSSVGSLAGIVGARLGFPLLDPLAGAVIAVFIIKAAVDIFIDAMAKMTDNACDRELQQAIWQLTRRQAGVLGIDCMRTRLFGDRVYVELEIRADPAESLEQAHATAHHVHDAIEEAFPQVKHCMIHVNPDD